MKHDREFVLAIFLTVIASIVFFASVVIGKVFAVWLIWFVWHRVKAAKKQMDDEINIRNQNANWLQKVYETFVYQDGEVLFKEQ